MRNSRSGSTPKTKTVNEKSISNSAEKTSTKKLKQARLPFKVIAPGTPPATSKSSGSLILSDTEKDESKDTHCADIRKRKLSYDTDDDCVEVGVKKDDNVSKENVKTSAAATKKKKICTEVTDDTITEVVSLLDDDEEDTKINKDAGSSALNSVSKDSHLETLKSGVKENSKSAGTSKAATSQKDKTVSSNKLQIKLPLSAGKKKRRKSSLNQLALKSTEADKTLNNSSQELSCDDSEDIAPDVNPNKRKRLNDRDEETETTGNNGDIVGQKQETEIVALDSEPESAERNSSKEILRPKRALRSTDEHKKQCSDTNRGQCEKSSPDSQTSDKSKQLKSDVISKSSPEKHSQNSKTNTKHKKLCGYNDMEKVEVSDLSDDNEKRRDDEEELEQSVLSDNDNEADDETDNLAGKSVSILSDVSDNSKSKPQNTQSQKEEGSARTVKNLTVKQVKLMEQRRKAREEKERKLQEEKIKKQQDKEEKELAKKREREEKEEQKRKDREEKEELKRKDREEKERKRLAEIEAKNEEKRKKNEAKEEELRKKEEERKRKEQEKEEAELKKKKAAQAFTKFFVAKTPYNVQLKNEEDSNTGDKTKFLAFRPFQIKGDMKLAPIKRDNLTNERKNRLDDLLGFKNKLVAQEEEEDDEVVRRKPLLKSQLYLSELRSGKILPGRWRRPSTESKDDVVIVEDELERVGQEIVEEHPAYVREEMRVKFYKFHDNRRPPYYGTWRKKSTVVKPRKPLAQDKKFFDYEVDSDDEWEEEEPGESLEDGSDEDKEKESEDDDYEVDNEWFVPHGHLSDEELQNQDEFGVGDDNTREAQKAKLKLLQQEFAQEMKKKTEKIKPRLIGCIWADINGNRPPECANILWDTLEKKQMLLSDPPLIEEPEVERSSETNSPSAAPNASGEKVTDKLKPINLSDNMIKDLTRLVHGNSHAKNFLINEYIAFIEKTEESVKNGGVRKPLKSVVRDKIDEIAEWQVVDATASSIQEMEQASDETNDKKKKKLKKRLCWVVKQEMLDKMDLSSLKLKNSWKYTLPPKFVKTEREVKVDEALTKSTAEGILNTTDDCTKERAPATPQTPKLTKKEIKKSQTALSSANIADNDSSSKGNASEPPKEKKRVPLLMSVPRGQQISTPAKNKLISKFLQQNNKESGSPSSPISSKSRSSAVTSPNVEDDDVVILD